MNRIVLLLVLMLVQGVARADSRAPRRLHADIWWRFPPPLCKYAITDPVVTPVRDVDLDAQRSACLRNGFSASVLSHALIDTPGFHGVLGGGLTLGGRFTMGEHLELSARLRVVDFAFVQNAVNKVTHTGIGPAVVGAALGDWISYTARGALVAQLEVPYTRDDTDTLHTSGTLAAVVTGRLRADLTLNARLGAVAMVASSTAGTTSRLGLVAGADLAWLVRRRVALQAGADFGAGWRGFDYVMPRAGVQWRMTTLAPWRLRAGVGAPLGGSERTNLVVDLAVVTEL